MTDILDLPGWAVIAKTKDAETDVLESEYTVQPTKAWAVKPPEKAFAPHSQQGSRDDQRR